MAHTIKNKLASTAAPSVSGSVTGTVYGPPENGYPHYRGVYVWESGTGSSRTYRWIEDEYCGNDVTSPTSYSFATETRS